MPICRRSRTALRYCPGGTLGSAGTGFESAPCGSSDSDLSLAALFSLLNMGRESNSDYALLQPKAVQARGSANTTFVRSLGVVLDFACSPVVHRRRVIF